MPRRSRASGPTATAVRRDTRAGPHGALADGSAVVLRVDGRLLYPHGPAVVVAEDDVRDLVNSDVVDVGG